MKYLRFGGLNFRRDLTEIPNLTGVEIPKRSVEDLITEILENTREELRRGEIQIKQMAEFDDKMKQVLQTFSDAVTGDLGTSAQRFEDARNRMISSITSINSSSDTFPKSMEFLQPIF